MNTLVKYNKQQLGTFKELAMIAAKSGSYQNMSPETLLNLMLSAADFGVSPMKAINGSFHIVKGKITMSGHLISDRIRAAGHSIKVTEHTREKCVIIGQRKDNGDSYKCEFDMEDAKLAGLLSSPTWKSYPKDMLYNRCIARLGRVLFSDVIGACYSEDEGYDIAGISPEKRPSKDPEEELIPIHQEMVQVEEKSEEIALEPFGPNVEKLRESFELDGIDTKHLDDFIKLIATQKKESPEELVSRALDPETLPRFKEFYLKKFSQKENPVQEERVQQ